jgi:hypothetical protein
LTGLFARETAAMTTPPDYDDLLESMQEELRVTLFALNDLHHPVYPSDPRRVNELERRISDLREGIVARRRELKGREQPPQRAALDPRAEAQQTAPPAKVPT